MTARNKTSPVNLASHVALTAKGTLSVGGHDMVEGTPSVGGQNVDMVRDTQGTPGLGVFICRSL